MEKYAEGSISYWGGMISSARRVEKTLLEPLISFRKGDLRTFKGIRSHLSATQSTYDSLLARYLSQSKSKEPSSLREDAFQVYEARKAYFTAAFDFCIAAPALRAGLDRALTKVLSDLWRDQAGQLFRSATHLLTSSNFCASLSSGVGAFGFGRTSANKGSSNISNNSSGQSIYVNVEC